jgi:hypothetical protein
MNTAQTAAMMLTMKKSNKVKPIGLFLIINRNFHNKR